MKESCLSKKQGLTLTELDHVSKWWREGRGTFNTELYQLIVKLKNKSE